MLQGCFLLLFYLTCLIDLLLVCSFCVPIVRTWVVFTHVFRAFFIEILIIKYIYIYILHETCMWNLYLFYINLHVSNSVLVKVNDLLLMSLGSVYNIVYGD